MIFGAGRFFGVMSHFAVDVTAVVFTSICTMVIFGIIDLLYVKLKVEPTSCRYDLELRLALTHWHDRAPKRARSQRPSFPEATRNVFGPGILCNRCRLSILVTGRSLLLRVSFA